MTTTHVPPPTARSPAPPPPAGHAAAKQSKMTIASVTRGKVAAPWRVAIYGTEGGGKTTWASGAPAPIFLPGEDGTNHLDVARFPRPESWGDVLDSIRTLTADPHDFKTLVIDTIDGLEPLCWKYVCDKGGKTDIESFGYGKGYNAALDEWRLFLAALERLCRARAMNVILIGHAQVRTFKNPVGPDYDRYSMKINDKAAGLIREWTDATLFATYEEFSVKDERNANRVRGVSSGARIVHTQRSAAWDAKNRFDLPEPMPLAFEDFASAVEAHRPGDPEKLRKEITETLALIGDAELAKKVNEAVKGAGDDAARLARIKDRVAAKAAAKE